MEISTITMPSITSILKKISDDRALTLFNSIGVSDGDRFMPIRELNLRTKQYYSRISGLLNAGLVKRHKGKYSLTFLGRVVYVAQTTIGKALSYHWQLKAIEAVEKSSASVDGLPKEKLTEPITTLIDNPQIKDILIKAILASQIRSGPRAVSTTTWSKEEEYQSCKS